MEKQHQEFLMKEYEALRKQIDNFLHEILQLEILALIASGVIWSWLATFKDPNIPRFVFFFPAGLTLLIGARSWGLQITTTKIGEYICSLEKFLELPNSLGWELHLKRTRSKSAYISGTILWMVIFATNLVISFFMK